MIMLGFAGWAFSGRRPPKLLTDAKQRQAQLREGRRTLCHMTQRDFGYDLAAWHAFLAKNDSGYRHPYGRSGVFQKIERAIADPRRQRLAENLAKEDAGKDLTIDSDAIARAELRAVRKFRQEKRREPLEALGIRPQILKILREQGVRTLGDLEKLTEPELRGMRGIGPVTIRSLISRMNGQGLTPRSAVLFARPVRGSSLPK
jgi:hypothetical protein